MNIHAIRTAWVRIKTAQVEGRGKGVARQLAIFTDVEWTQWLPTYAWAIDHPEGVIVVDTGQAIHLLKTGNSLHPYVRWEVEFRIEREEEIGPQLRILGIGQHDIQATKRGERFGKRRGNGLFIPSLGHGGCQSSTATQPLGSSLQLFSGPAHEHHFSSLGQKEFGRRLANAAGGASDEGDFVL